MKTFAKKIMNLWKSDTPVISRFAQIILSVITAVLALWSTMPEQYKVVKTAGELKAIALTGIIATALLQLTKTKEK